MNDPARLHSRTRERGVNLLVYGIVRLLFQTFFHLWFRMERIGREHIPRSGPVIVASNHRSFLDPFVIATMARRPMYYVAKQEMFTSGWRSWLLSALGAYPVARGTGDAEMVATSQAILARGGIVLIFPEGTRTRPGPLGTPHRGVGRLALETGVPVVPVAVFGTESVRRGWRIRPHKVRIRAGRPLTFPRVQRPSRGLAAAVAARIWPCVMLQWEWLGGMAPVRRVAVIGAGTWGTSLAVALGRAGLEVDLGCRTQEQALALRMARENAVHLPGVTLPDSVRVARASELALDGHDLVCLAVPAAALPAALAAHGGHIPARAGLLVAAKGLVAPLGTLPAAFAAQRCAARAVAVLGGPAHGPEMIEHGASVVVTSADRAFARQLAGALAAARLDVTRSSDVIGVQLAGCASAAAGLAAVAAAGAGPGVAGAAAGKVFAELDALARCSGARPGTFAGLAGSGDLVATILAAGRGDEGASLADDADGGAAEAIGSVQLLVAAARSAGVRAPALHGLAALLAGELAPEQWTSTGSPPCRPVARSLCAPRERR
jgi:1-acyl-sn-glycerol-3-phosphate acyltransferase